LNKVQQQLAANLISIINLFMAGSRSGILSPKWVVPFTETGGILSPKQVVSFYRNIQGKN
jgi:hypothetical protein